MEVFLFFFDSMRQGIAQLLKGHIITKVSYIKAETKWLPFSIRYIQMHFFNKQKSLRQ